MTAFRKCICGSYVCGDSREQNPQYRCCNCGGPGNATPIPSAQPNKENKAA